MSLSDQLCADVETLRRDGYVIIRDILGPDAIQHLNRQAEPWLRRTPRCEGDFHGWATTRVNGVLSKAPEAQALALHPRVLPIIELLLSDACDCIRLNMTQLIRIHPGETAQIPHRDEEMWPMDPQGQVVSVNVMWALSPFTRENGATRLWRGSHVNRLGRDASEADATFAEMAPGSAVIYVGGVTHGGGANLSDGDRTGLVVGYCVGWLRTYEEQFLAYPREVARTFPEPLQRLIGYRHHRPNLGSWEGQDPLAYLHGANVCGAHRDALPPAIEAELSARARAALR